MATNEDNQNSTNNKTMEQCYENYILVDVGANLTNKKYSRDLESVIQRARDSGVQKIMVTGTSVKSSKEALRLTRIYPGTLYSTAGIHPHDAKSYTDESWNELKVVASNPECVAVGECGLDYNRNFSEPSEQRQVFRKHIELAIEINKPLFVHERDGHDDLLEILDQYKGRLPPVLIHCFTGTAEQALTYLSRGFYIGLTGNPVTAFRPTLINCWAFSRLLV
jgi:TatD DNase family protein